MYIDDDTIFGVVFQMLDLKDERQRSSRSCLTMSLKIQGLYRCINEMKMVLDQLESHREMSGSCWRIFVEGSSGS